MQSTSFSYKSIIASGNYWFEPKVVIDGAGTIDESRIFELRTATRLFQGSPEIGKAVAGEIDLKVLAPNASIPTMGEVRPYVRAHGKEAFSSAASVAGETLNLQGATYSSGSLTIPNSSGAAVSNENLSFPISGYTDAVSEWIPQGVYYIDTRETTQNNDGLDVLTIHGYDAMLKAELEYSPNAQSAYTSYTRHRLENWESTAGDNYDTAYVAAIAKIMGVNVDNRTWGVMQNGRMIPFPLGYSMRELLGYIAAYYVGSFVMTDEGNLRLVSLTDILTETNLLVDPNGDTITFGGTAILI